MNRTAYKALLSWKSTPHKKPLLVQGARQVGKTYLIQEFGKKEYKYFVSFNFEETPRLKSLFEGDIDPQVLFTTLGAWSGLTIRPENTLIFFDEIQACPRALTALKYFKEKAPLYSIIAAGSLLGVSAGKQSSFPVGKVAFLTIYPLSFLEFLEGSGEHELYELLLQKNDTAAFQDIIHDKFLETYMRYLFIGGMPEVVETFNQTNDFQATRKIQTEIIRAYERDFSKYTTPTQAIRIAEIWRSIPAHLARENKKFKYGNVKKNGRASQFESALEWLKAAGLVYLSTNCTAPRLPLSGYEDHNRFKVYLLDCGLLGALVNLPPRTIVDGNSLFSEYNGAFVENFAATELAQTNEGTLHYWISDGIAEIDFIVHLENDIYPIEIKSGLIKSIKGLRIYADKFHPRRIVRASPRNFESHENFINIPLYATGLFQRFVQMQNPV